MNNNLLLSSGSGGKIDTSGVNWVDAGRSSWGGSTTIDSSWFFVTNGPASLIGKWIIRNAQNPRTGWYVSDDNGVTITSTTDLNFFIPDNDLSGGYEYIQLCNDTVNNRLMACVITSTNIVITDHIGNIYLNSSKPAQESFYPYLVSTIFNYTTGVTIAFYRVNATWYAATSQGNIYTISFLSNAYNQNTSFIPVSSMAYGNGVYVVAYVTTADNGANTYTRFYSSTDLQNWTLRFTLPVGQGFGTPINDIIYNRFTSTFLACGWKGTLVTSSNGTSWTVRNSNPNTVLASHNCQLGIYNSANDTHIFPVSSPRTRSWNVIPFTSGSFSYTSEGPGGSITTTANDSAGRIPYTSKYVRCMNAIAYSPTLNRYVMVGHTEYAQYSNDSGSTWIQSKISSAYSYGSSTNARQYYGIAWGAGRFVAVGGGYNTDNYTIWTSQSSNIISYSSTGLANSWVNAISNTGLRIFTDVAFSTASTRFVVGAMDYNTNTPTPLIWYSSDGVNWLSTTLPSISGYSDRVFFTKLSYITDKNVFIGLTNKPGLVGFSTDGLSWTFTTVNSNYTFYSIVYGNNVLILGSDNAFITIQIPSTVTTSVFNTYSVYSSSTNLGQIQGGSYSSSDGWIIAGTNIIIKSANSTTWTEYGGSAFYDSSGPSGTLQKMDYSTYDGTTVILGTGPIDRTVIYTTDGVSLTQRVIPYPSDYGLSYGYYSIAYGNYKFLAGRIRSPN